MNWIEYGKGFKNFLAEGLADAGVVIHLTGHLSGNDVEEVLFGDLNTRGGACECCGVYYENGTVLRYARAWESAYTTNGEGRMQGRRIVT